MTLHRQTPRLGITAAMRREEARPSGWARGGEGAEMPLCACHAAHRAHARGTAWHGDPRIPQAAVRPRAPGCPGEGGARPPPRRRGPGPRCPCVQAARGTWTARRDSERAEQRQVLASAAASFWGTEGGRPPAALGS